MPPTFILSQNQTLQLVISINSCGSSPAMRSIAARRPKELKSLLKVLKSAFTRLASSRTLDESQNQYDLALASQDDSYKEPPTQVLKKRSLTKLSKSKNVFLPRPAQRQGPE
jgi:hypothetical protein